MKPVWLIETGLWKDDNVVRMIRILRELGATVHAEPYTPFGAAEFDVSGDECPAVFYGSVNTAEYLRATRRNWVPLTWFDKDAFSCRSYFAHWGKYLLQEHYGFYPLGELPRLREILYQTYAKNGLVFIRPDDNDKSFSGRLVAESVFSQWYEETRATSPDPAALVVIASPVRIGGEWRFVIADRKVVAGSYYKWAGAAGPSGDDLTNAGKVVEEIAAAPWQPRAIYCADVTRNEAGQYRLVEINGINSSGLYHCDLLSVVQAMNEIAVRDFRYWKGKG